MHRFFTPSPSDQHVLAQHYCERLRIHVVSFRSIPCGLWVGGEIINVDDTTLARDLVNRSPMFWPDTGTGAGTGVPIQQLLIDVQTDEQDPADFRDTGVRRFFIKQDNLYYPDGADKPGTPYRALVEELTRTSGLDALPCVGGQWWMRWTGEIHDNPRFSPRKRYEARYIPPTVEESSP